MAARKPDKLLALIDKALEASTAVPVEGGSLEVPLARIGALYMLPWSCYHEMRCGLKLTTTATRKSTPVKTTALYVSPEDTREALRIVREINTTLKPDMDGELEMLSIATSDMYSAQDEDDEDSDDEDMNGKVAPEIIVYVRKVKLVCRMRFRGTVKDGVCSISHTFPKSDRTNLQKTFSILDQVDGSSNRWTSSAAEAVELVAAAKKTSGFMQSNPAQVNANSIEARGEEVLVKEDRRAYLAMVVLRQQLASGPWDLTTHKQGDEKFVVDYMANIEQMNKRMAEARAKYNAPRLCTLLETMTATYYETDFAKILWGEMSLASILFQRFRDLDYRSEMSFTEAIARFDKEFAAIGLRHLGDFQNSLQTPQTAWRAYGGAANGDFALVGVVAGNFILHVVFYSLLGKDFWVSTGTFTLPDNAPRPARNSHRGDKNWTWQQMQDQHRENVKANATHGAPVPSPNNIQEFVVLMDRFNAAMEANKK
jgi:hypothetical protein